MTPAVVAWPDMGPEPLLPGPPSCEVYAIGPYGRHVPIGAPTGQPAPLVAAPVADTPVPAKPRQLVAPPLSEDL